MALPLDAPDHLRNRVLRRYRDHHVHAILASGQFQFPLGDRAAQDHLEVPVVLLPQEDPEPPLLREGLAVRRLQASRQRHPNRSGSNP